MKRKIESTEFEWYHGFFLIAFITTVWFVALNTSGLVKPVKGKPKALKVPDPTTNLVVNQVIFY